MLTYPFGSPFYMIFSNYRAFYILTNIFKFITFKIILVRSLLTVSNSESAKTHSIRD